MRGGNLAASRTWWLPLALTVALLSMLPSSAAASKIAASDRPSLAVLSSSQQGPMDPRELETFMDGVMAAQLQAHHVPGAAVSVVKDGELFFAKGYGYTNRETRTPVDPDRTIFRIGSVTKLFVGTAVMQQVEAGVLDLNADVGQYLEEVQIPAAYDEPITLANLLTHTAGFEEVVIGLYARSPEEIDPLALLLAEELPARIRPPGRFAAYSNHGFGLAGLVVEQVSGKPWELYLEERVFGPLGMENTTAVQPVPGDLPGELAQGYEYTDGQYRAGPEEIIAVSPAGSMSSTATDMASFMIAHLEEGRYQDTRVLEADTARLMHQRQFTHDSRVNGIGYAFYEMDSHGQRIIGHGGDTFLFHSLVALLPEHDIGLFVSYNGTGGTQARDGLLNAFLDHYYPVPVAAVPQPPAGFQQEAGRFTGSYRSTRTSYTTPARLTELISTLSVTTTDEGYLVGQLPGTEARRYVQVEPLLFRDVDRGQEAVFQVNEEGQITHLFLDEVPIMAFVKLAWYETPIFHLSLLGASVLIFLSTLLLFPLGALLRRDEGWNGATGTRLSRAARWLAWILGLMSLVIVAGIVIAMANPTEVASGFPPLLRAILILPVPTAVLGVVVFILGIVGWWQGYWGRIGRVHYTLVGLAALVFLWELSYWNLLGLNT